MNFEELAALPECAAEIKRSGLPVYIYGMGNGGEKVLKWCADRGIRAEGVFASDDFVRGQSFCGYEVKKLSQVEEEVGEFIVLLAFGTCLPEIMERIDDISQKHMLYAPDVPVAGDRAFDRADLFSDIKRAEKVYDMLEDEQSRKVFMGLTASKITGRLGYLKEIFTDGTKPSPLLCLKKGEIYCDLGAYNGDTVLQTVKSTGGCKKIYALEPEKRNFQKCVRNCTDIDDIEFINAAAWSQDTVMGFDGGAGRQARLDGDGRGLIAARSLDSVLGGRECTYIKYDVEGADIPALKGSEKTIAKYHPKLCCALYHRCYDYIDIPLAVNEIYGGYSFYMRQESYYPAWETELICVPKDRKES